MGRRKDVRVAVLRTAGTNCDYETAWAFERAGARVERVHINRLVEKPGRLGRFHVLAVPGGFSYGDDIASGKLLANEIRYSLESEMRGFMADGGLIIGICNGFQVLVKAGFLPGIRRGKVEATLTFNDSARFEDRWVYLKAESTRCAFVRPGEDMYLPVAHAEGKFVTDARVLAELEAKGLVVFRYTDAGGRRGAGYPWNPNGSMADIAGGYRWYLRPDGAGFRSDAASGAARGTDAASTLDARGFEGRGRRGARFQECGVVRAGEPCLTVAVGGVRYVLLGRGWR